MPLQLVDSRLKDLTDWAEVTIAKTLRLIRTDGPRLRKIYQHAGIIHDLLYHKLFSTQCSENISLSDNGTISSYKVQVYYFDNFFTTIPLYYVVDNITQIILNDEIDNLTILNYYDIIHTTTIPTNYYINELLLSNTSCNQLFQSLNIFLDRYISTKNHHEQFSNTAAPPSSSSSSYSTSSSSSYSSSSSSSTILKLYLMVSSEYMDILSLIQLYLKQYHITHTIQSSSSTISTIINNTNTTTNSVTTISYDNISNNIDSQSIQLHSELHIIHIQAHMIYSNLQTSCISKVLQAYINAAIALSPCILLLDDLHLITPSPSSTSYQQHSSIYQDTMQVIHTLLNHVSILGYQYPIFIIGCSLCSHLPTHLISDTSSSTTTDPTSMYSQSISYQDNNTTTINNNNHMYTDGLNIDCIECTIHPYILEAFNQYCYFPYLSTLERRQIIQYILEDLISYLSRRITIIQSTYSVYDNMSYKYNSWNIQVEDKDISIEVYDFILMVLNAIDINTWADQLHGYTVFTLQSYIHTQLFELTQFLVSHQITSSKCMEVNLKKLIYTTHKNAIHFDDSSNENVSPHMISYSTLNMTSNLYSYQHLQSYIHDLNERNHCYTLQLNSYVVDYVLNIPYFPSKLPQDTTSYNNNNNNSKDVPHTAVRSTDLIHVKNDKNNILDEEIYKVISTSVSNTASNSLDNTITTKEIQLSSTNTYTNHLKFHGICGHQEIKQQLIESIIWPRMYTSLYNILDMIPDTGILLYGPPGTGKTLFPSILSKELKYHFVNLKLTDVVKGTIGSGEQAIFKAFQEARQYAPSLLFIDEFQATFTSRSHEDNTGSSLTYALSSCFDDINLWNKYAGSQSFVLILAATNEPWCIDTGFIRHGRFDKMLFVGPLNSDGRKEYFTQWFQQKYAVIQQKLLQKRITASNAVSSDNKTILQNSQKDTFVNDLLVDELKTLSLYKNAIDDNVHINDTNNNHNNHNNIFDHINMNINLVHQSECTPMSANTDTSCTNPTRSMEDYLSFIDIVVTWTEGYTGADCSLLMKKACYYCYQEFITTLTTTTTTSSTTTTAIADRLTLYTDTIVDNGTNIENNATNNENIQTSCSNNTTTATNILPLSSSEEEEDQYLLPSLRHFQLAYDNITCSVTAEEIQEYMIWKQSIQLS